MPRSWLLRTAQGQLKNPKPSEAKGKIISWELIIGLLVKFGPSGFQMVQSIIEKWSSGKPPTAADIEELRVLGTKTPRSQMEAALTRAGIALDSEQGKAMLALV